MKEPILNPMIGEKDALSLLRIYENSITIIDHDVIYYPVYLATIKGEGRTRYLFLDGTSGTVDEPLTDNAKVILKDTSREKDDKRSRK